MYTPEEIEKKRLRALELRKSRMHENSTKSSPTTAVLNNGNVTPNSPAKRKSEFCLDCKPFSAKVAKQIQALNPEVFFKKSSDVIKGSCTMITPKRFNVDVPYYQPLINFFKGFNTKAYDQKTKLWSFDIKEYDKFMSELKTKLPNVSLEGIPKFVLQTFKKQTTIKTDDEGLDLSHIDKKLLGNLMPFQKEGICFGIRMNGRCIIADDMGLGKTIQALGIAHYYKDNWPLLIVTPSSVRYQWSEAIFQFLPSVLVQQVFQFTNAKDCLGNEQITIVSYDGLVRSVDKFVAKKFGMIILDESHILKNHKTSRTKAVERVAAQALRIILLSGTPALSRPIELYSQIRLFYRPFMTLQDYGSRYCAANRTPYGMDYTGSSNVGELQLLLKACCLIRRLKKDVLKQLPSKIRQVIILDPSLIAAGTEKMHEMAAKLQECKNRGVESHTTLVQLYNESSYQRVKAVRNYIKDLLENDQKFIVFAHHQCVLDGICEVLDSKKTQYIRIDGKTSAEHRKQRVDWFQSSDDCLVAVLSITATNTGITLTAANFVVFAELYWNPGILCQAEDRVHRIGQDFGVVIQYLVAQGTVDDYLWPLIQRKMNFLSSAGLHQDFSLSQADVIIQEPTETSLQQKTLDTFVISQVNETVNETNVAGDSAKSSDAIKKSLDENEEDFANLCWDNIE